MNFHIILLCFIFAMFLPAAVSAEDFVIQDFSDHITIHGDSSFTVKETISVEFLRPRHGLYREIPYIYKDSLGREVRTPTDVISVTDGSGKKVRYKATHKGNIIHIRIGDPGKFVSGAQTYQILYEVENAVSFFDSHDELYWNVTGNFWTVPVKKASCSVSLGSAKKTMELRASCYTGDIGSTESACRYDPSGNFIEFIASRPLSPGEGFTVVYGWDKGLVYPPSSFRRFLWTINLSQNWVFIVPLLSLIVMVRLWYTRGRDPRVRESVTVMYGPPKYGETPLTPAEMGALVDESLDPRDITATIVGLAVKGYIKIEETKEEGIIFDSKDYYLGKIKEPDDALSAFEKMLMSTLFSGPTPGIQISELKNSFYKNIDLLKKAVFGELVTKKFFTVSPENVKQLYIGAAFVTAVFCVAVLSYFFGDSAGAGRTGAAGLLAGLPIFGLAKFMAAKTRAGAIAYMDILGFQEFLNRAEKDRLIRMQDENLFSRFLPYALALGVAENWARAFEGIYQQPPQWYVSPTGYGTFNPKGFNLSLGAAMSSLSSAMFSAPRGSGTGGFGGGGSSGGGFGGGGGGSW